MGKSNGAMTAGSSGAVGGVQKGGKGGCCSCRSMSWVNYILSMLSITFSIVILWLCLYRTRQLALQVESLMANSTLASTMASTSTEDFDLAVLRQLIMKVERNTEHNSAQMERLRSRPNWDDIRDSIQKELEAKIEDVRSTHGNIIDSLAVKLSGWENASALTLKVLNKLKSKLNELEELQVTNRQDIMNLDRDLQEVWRELESQGRLISDRNQRKPSSELRSQILDELLTNENASNSSMAELKMELTELLQRTNQLSDRLDQDMKQIRDKVSAVDDRLAETSRGVELMNLTSENRFELHDEQLEMLTSGLTSLEQSNEVLTASTTSDLSYLRKGLSDVDLQTQLLKTNLDQQLQDVQLRLEEVLETKTEVQVLRQRVEHFVQSLLKVKTLPAAVNILEKRIESLGMSLTNAVKLMDKSELLDLNITETVNVAN